MNQTFYCVKCKEKVEAEGELVTMKNGKKAYTGRCETCGTKLFKFTKSTETQARYHE